MGTQDVDAKVFDIAHDLMRRGPTQEEIDGRFLFEVWDGEWISWVKKVRRAFFGQDSAPYHASKRTKAPQEVLDDMGADTRGSLEHVVESKSYETGLAVHDLLGQVLAGSPIALPRLSIVDSTDGISDIRTGLEFRPRMAVLIYASDVSGDEVSRFYSAHSRSRHLLLPDTEPRGRRQATQQPKNLIRTWTVSCLVRQGEMAPREAITAWNHRYPQHSYGSPDETTQSKSRQQAASATSAAEVQYSHDKQRLFDRLHLTR